MYFQMIRLFYSNETSPLCFATRSHLLERKARMPYRLVALCISLKRTSVLDLNCTTSAHRLCLTWRELRELTTASQVLSSMGFCVIISLLLIDT